MELSELTAIVTGASRGIGKSIALKLAENGISLALVGRDEKALRDLETELKTFGVKTLVLAYDLGEAENLQKIISETHRAFKRLDILVNNAALAELKPLKDTTFEDWDKIMAVNAKAPYFLCKAAIPCLKESDHGTIVNISSVVGRLGYENQSAYSASKHALMGFSKVLAREVQPLGIRVHTIAPGGVGTEMVKTMRPDLDTSKLIQPEEIAEIVLFLVKHRGNAMIDNINVRRANGTPFI